MKMKITVKYKYNSISNQTKIFFNHQRVVIVTNETWCCIKKTVFECEKLKIFTKRNYDVYIQQL